MASHLGAWSRATPFQHTRTPFILPLTHLLTTKPRNRPTTGLRIRVSSDGNSSYLDMWKSAIDRERKAVEFEKIAGNLDTDDDDDNEVDGPVDLGKKTEEFTKILEVSKEERDRVQRLQVIDRAAAAIAAARAIIKDKQGTDTGDDGQDLNVDASKGTKSGDVLVTRSEGTGNVVPGPDFWSWSPPPNSDRNAGDAGDLQTVRKVSVYPTLMNNLAVKERSSDFLSIPFESKRLEANPDSPIPPLQSESDPIPPLQSESEEMEMSESSIEMPSKMEEEGELGVQFSVHAEEAARALHEDKDDQLSSTGVNPDGSRWWKETGVEQRPNGVICRWTMHRGVSAEQDVEWQEKFWEAADEFGYRELGSEKSGRSANGNVWREYWKESLWPDSGLLHIEKTADKWGENGEGDEWQEKWWEHYDSSGKADKWAHKWCSIDPSTNLEAGHAHVWHERWGEKYDGQGSSIKYTDKWAERCEVDGWTKWGDKWDENFNSDAHGVKQGESWWEGKHGERWNRTWGERHNGSGWVHKYGKSSRGEHWDTHTEQETWYERHPHYGFFHCFDNSVQLREVQIPTKSDEP